MKAPSPLDVVWCYFPTRERLTQPGPKLRPVLVLGHHADGRLIVAVYGTSQAHGILRTHEVRAEIERGTQTTFDLSRMLPVPWTAGYFPPRPRLGAWPLARLPELVKAREAARRR